MIRIVRGPEPPALARARRKRLAVAIAAYDAHGAPSPELTACLIGYKLPAVKRALHRAQRKKCAWCERVSDYSSSPVEHHRPKDGAWRNRRSHPRQSSGGHYWWLTWTWENLLFSCVRCNDQGHKANYFPLDTGSAECVVPARPAGASMPDVRSERPMLLDPTTDGFLEHVRWVPFNTTFPWPLWTWSPKALTPRGEITIEVMKLHELSYDVEMHLKNSVLPNIQTIEQHLRGRRFRQAADAWDSLIKILDRENPLTAATWCALERWMPPAKRRRHGLAHPPRPV